MGITISHFAVKDVELLEKVEEELAVNGVCVIDEVCDGQLLDKARLGLYRAQEAIHKIIGVEKLAHARELGTLRIPMLFDPVFFEFLCGKTILSMVDRLIGSTAILHLQNGFILPSFSDAVAPAVFQNTFHRDFPRYLNGYRASINVFVAVDAFTEVNGATLFVPGSHQREGRPSDDYITRHSVRADAEAGSIVVFDSTIWHAAGANRSGSDRLAINHQFTYSYIKQQIDYVRALGQERLNTLPERTQQILGQYTRVVTSLEEYYRPEADRLYRKNQG